MEKENIITIIKERIEEVLPESIVSVFTGSPGHYNIEVISKIFEGKTLLAQQRLVYSAITDLMKGHKAPVHAIDSMKTMIPQ